MKVDKNFAIGCAVGAVAVLVLLSLDDDDDHETKVENPRRQLAHVHYPLSIMPGWDDASF